MEIKYLNQGIMSTEALLYKDGQKLMRMGLKPISVYVNRKHDYEDDYIPFTFSTMYEKEMCSTKIPTLDEEFLSTIHQAGTHLLEDQPVWKSLILFLPAQEMVDVFTPMLTTYAEQHEGYTFFDHQQTVDMMTSWPRFIDRFLSHDVWNKYISIFRTADLPKYQQGWVKTNLPLK
jgi:hypothetical protein